MGNNDFVLWINDRLLTFNPEDDCQTTIGEGRLKIRLTINATGYDLSHFILLVGGDGYLPGFPVHLFRSLEGDLYGEDEDLIQLAGQKFFGLTSIELLYRERPLPGGFTQVRIEPGENIKQQVMIMRDELQRHNATILDFYGLSMETFDIDILSDWAQFDLELEGFLLLQQFSKHAGPFLIAQSELLDCELVNQGESITVPIQKAHPITAALLVNAYRSNEPFYSNPNNSGTITIGLPKRVPISRKTLNYNTVLNQQSMSILRRMETETQKIINHIEKEIVHKNSTKFTYHGGYANYSNFLLSRLHIARRLSKDILYRIQYSIETLTTLGVNKNYRAPKISGTIKPIYAALFTAYHDYKNQLAYLSKVISFDEQTFPLQTYSINRLYEIWVVQIILQVMVERLGFVFLEQEIEKATFYVKQSIPLLRSGQTLHLLSPQGDHVYYHYDKKYPLLSDHNCFDLLGFMPRVLAGRGMVKKNNPDISIEFYKGIGKSPKLLIFDATYSNRQDIHDSKNLYENTIFYRPSQDAPHDKWKQPVRKSVAVHPMQRHDELPRRGEFVLIPFENAKDQTELYLKNIFEDEELI